MPIFEQGDVVRVPFPYTDGATLQRRPALVISAGGVGDARQLLWVTMITSAANRSWPGDLPFGEAYGSAGLPAPSVVRSCKIATIDAHRAERLGKVRPEFLAKVLTEVRGILGERAGT